MISKKMVSVLLMIFSVTAVMLILLPPKAEAYVTSPFPVSNAVSASVSTFNLDTLAQDQRLALISLQGLVNRTTPRIYLYHSYNPSNTNVWIMDYYKSKSYVTSETVYTDVYTMINTFKSSISGAVVYDPAKDYTINIATNVAGVENRIIISPSMISSIQALGITDIKDLRTNNFASPYAAYVWAYNTYWPSQRHDILANTYYVKAHDYHRDYLIQFKICTFWLPGPTDPDYSSSLQGQIQYEMQHADGNTPILGFWYAQTDAGLARGIGEFGGVKLAGQFGKFTVVNDWSGGYSFHSGIQVSSSTFRQNATRQKAFNTYDPTKKYVAFTMIESGDSPGYMQYGFRNNQWNDAMRGQVAYNIGVTPTMKYLLPGVLRWMYESATTNDYFFNSISGDGYMYPLEGYGDYGVMDSNNTIIMNKDQLLSDYYKKTGLNMNALDFDMLGMYGHIAPNTWSAADDTLLNTYMTGNIQGLTSIIAGMGRDTGITPANANSLMYDNTTMHHTLTVWSATSYGGPNDTTQDTAAVNYLVNEITSHSSGSNFLEDMALSWDYGPRRLKMVKDALTPSGYVFVTLNEFDSLYRESLNLPLPSRDPNNVNSTKITGATATSSTFFGVGYEASKAIDGNNATDWATTAADKNTGWIRLTWGSSQSINKIVLKDRSNAADQIMGGTLTFSDGSSLNIPALSNPGKGYAFEFPAKNVTWVQFTINSTSGSTFASGLSEFEAYNTPMPVYYIDFAKNQPVTSSGIFGVGYEAAKAVDGNDTTRWASNTGSTWIRVDLGASKFIDNVVLKWEAAGAYTIQTSPDDITYTTVKSGTAASNTTTTDLLFKQARYVKVTGTDYRSIWTLAVNGHN